MTFDPKHWPRAVIRVTLADCTLLSAILRASQAEGYDTDMDEARAADLINRIEDAIPRIVAKA